MLTALRNAVIENRTHKPDRQMSKRLTGPHRSDTARIKNKRLRYNSSCQELRNFLTALLRSKEISCDNRAENYFTAANRPLPVLSHSCSRTGLPKCASNGPYCKFKLPGFSLPVLPWQGNALPLSYARSRLYLNLGTKNYLSVLLRRLFAHTLCPVVGL